MSLDIAQATPEQIAEFKQAAAARYTERGIAPNVAEQLFNNQMGKVAAEMGIELDADKKSG